ncbi:MAG: histidine kinase [Psychroflexus sp.]|nr:histidine kinase [Psychroflexus sp.]
MQKILQNRMTWIVLALLVVGVGHYFLLLHIDVSPRAAVSDAMGNYFCLLFFIFILQRLHVFYHSRSAINMVYIGVITVFSLLISFLVQGYGDGIAAGDDVYRDLLGTLFYIRWFVVFLILLVIVNLFWIDEHVKEQAQAFDRLVEKERQLTKAEINNLQQQFQPHFLFNSLNSISALLKKRPEKAREMLLNLSEFLRMTLRKGETDFAYLAEEIDCLNLYMAIEKVRFGNRLSVAIEQEGDCRQAQLPALILQPLIENAIKYGLNSKTDQIYIRINTRCHASHLFIEVQNPYDDNDVSTQKGTGFGLESIERKLKFLYKQNGLLQIRKQNEIFEVTLKIPQ